MNFLDYSELASSEGLERELQRVRAAAAGDAQGVFGPRSFTWQIDRESAIFFGAGRALLLQLAHPWVAAAIKRHSNAFADPVGRFHRAFSTVFAMVFGTLDQSMNAARRLHRRHASITGRLPRTAGPFALGSPYHANTIPALRWVYATLIGAMAVRQKCENN
jgi:uncharacterized protein (DUF2236 family)